MQQKSGLNSPQLRFTLLDHICWGTVVFRAIYKNDHNLMMSLNYPEDSRVSVCTTLRLVWKKTFKYDFMKGGNIYINYGLAAFLLYTCQMLVSDWLAGILAVKPPR